MADWIERYVYDVTRRLPERERADVRQELTSNIQDMLPEPAGEEEVKAVLCQLGAPATLAEQYRQNPRYLISPAVYGEYVRLLKLLVPLVGGILLVLGMVLGGVGAIGEGELNAGRLVGRIVAEGLATGIPGALHALLWTTVAFVIVERAGYRAAQGTPGWRVEDLPEVPLSDKSRIPLSDSIAELVVTAVFAVFGILLCTRALPIAFSFTHSGVQVQQFFSDSFLAACLPVILLAAALTIAQCIIKIVFRRWALPVCLAVIVDNLASVALMLYVFSMPDMLSPEFSTFLKTADLGRVKMLSFMGERVEAPILTIIAIVVIVIAVVECATAIYRTAKAASARSAA